MILLSIVFIVCITNSIFVLLIRISIIISINNNIALKISGKRSLHMKKFLKKLIFLTFIMTLSAQFAAADDVDEISKKLANPVSDLHNLPLRYDYDKDVGPYYGTRNTLRVQPILSFKLNDEWSVISRTVIPLITQHDVIPDSTQTGVGDIQESLFFSTTTKSKVIVGFGPIFSIPTYDNDFSSKRFGAGPTALVLIDPGKWTIGGMANHVWSFAGPGTDGDKGYFSKTLVQPFITYQLPKGWSIGLNSESTYDWKEDEWLIPLTLQVSKVAKIGNMPISFALAPNYYVERPDSGPRWGARAIVTFVF